MIFNEVLSDNLPNSVLIAQSLVMHDVVSAAYEAVPIITGDTHSSHASTGSIEYLLSETTQGGYEWLQTDWYKKLMARTLGGVLFNDSMQQQDITERLARLTAAYDPLEASLPAPKTAELEEYILRSAEHDALTVIGWLKDGIVPAAVRAMYLHRRADMYKSEDQAIATLNPQIRRAHKIYKYRLDRMFRYAPYVELANLTNEPIVRRNQVVALNNGAADTPTGLWWKQVVGDMGRFKTSII